MRRFHCPACRGEIFFGNTECLNCGSALVYAPGQGFVAGATRCANRAAIGCNWAADEAGGLCLSCRHTILVPDLSVAGNTERWARIESAKRPVMRALHALGLPLTDAQGAPSPAFALKGDPGGGAAPRVLTGHDHGTITLNIAEADDAAREAMRSAMGEPYRTLTGHFRHEVAHHYWEVLTRGHPGRLAALRQVFGDERQDYAAALAAHYRDGPPIDWAQDYISAYATAHPAEDFAETWAHVLHLLDALETARAFGLVPADLPQDPAGLAAVEMPRLAAVWIELSLALNAVSQALGHQTFYPFVLNRAVIDKMEAVRALIVGTDADTVAEAAA